MLGNRDPLEKGTGQDAHIRRTDVLERMPVIHTVILQTAAGEAATNLLQVAGPPGAGRGPWGGDPVAAPWGNTATTAHSAGRAGGARGTHVKQEEALGCGPALPARKGP